MTQQAELLHIRCGSDIHPQLEQAGLLENADFLEFSDPFCLGPINHKSLNLKNIDPWVSQRSQFIAEAFELDFTEVQQKQQSSYQLLSNASQYSQIILWFEHDCYDQLILIYLLFRLSQQKLKPGQLQLICINQHAELEQTHGRFIGLGQLNSEQIQQLWQQKKPVTNGQLIAASCSWERLAKQQPLQIITSNTGTTLPFLKQALQRYAEQQSKVSLTDQITLDILQQKSPITFSELFKAYQEKEPQPWLGDLMYWYLLRGMAENGLVNIEPSQRTQNNCWASSVIYLR
ncbi:DUF1835 domain-containing protein [Pelagibaculum spongiae]|uniref:DUF1835 domain-containing protein n=1 Tax=Pelagibaculum spongiae TaxID=2080658 RepID=A0A2V1H1T9_9GAMM|nr:DUF1835 domain-containing protein [Pelagibaculum spongiae]PVZ70341.1 hypothetical protein DC094_07030 [Pelagibaculum spongiae]